LWAAAMNSRIKVARWAGSASHTTSSLRPQLMQQMAEKVDYLRSADGTLIETEAEVPPGYAGCGREHLLIKMCKRWELGLTDS
jgi:hypothetical protein